MLSPLTCNRAAAGEGAKRPQAGGTMNGAKGRPRPCPVALTLATELGPELGLVGPGWGCVCHGPFGARVHEVVAALILALIWGTVILSGLPSLCNRRARSAVSLRQ
jgi:hypothetical protein